MRSNRVEDSVRGVRALGVAEHREKTRGLATESERMERSSNSPLEARSSQLWRQPAGCMSSIPKNIHKKGNIKYPKAFVVAN